MYLRSNSRSLSSTFYWFVREVGKNYYNIFPRSILFCRHFQRNHIITTEFVYKYTLFIFGNVYLCSGPFTIMFNQERPHVWVKNLFDNKYLLKLIRIHRYNEWKLQIRCTHKIRNTFKRILEKERREILYTMVHLQTFGTKEINKIINSKWPNRTTCRNTADTVPE